MTPSQPANSWQKEMLGDVSLKDQIDVLRRRKMWIILTAVAVFSATAVVAMRLPNFYTSQTTILIDPQQVPSNYVPTTVTTTVADRLSTIREEIMSPTRLKSIIDKLGLYPELRGKVSNEGIVKKMQASINLQVADAGSQRLSAVNVGFTSYSPQDASRVANELASMVIDENLKARHEEFYGTAEFLDSELEDTKKQLQGKEDELERIKSQNILDLPEAQQYHMEALSNLRMQLQASQDRVNAAQQQRVYLQSLMASYHPTVDLDTGDPGGGGGGSPSQSEVQKLETQLAELRVRYGPRHPDVLRVEADLQKAKARALAEQKEAPPSPQQPQVDPSALAASAHENPVITAQLNKLNQDIQDQTKLQASLQDQINLHASKLEQEPAFQEKIGGLMRDYDTLRAHYNNLLDKKLSADMAAALDSSQKGERFVILDSAPIPDAPAGPKRLLIILSGLFGGILGGVGLALAVEMTDASVKSESQASRILGWGVLAEIPVVLTKQQIRRKQILSTGALFATALCSTGAGLLISTILRKFV